VIYDASSGGTTNSEKRELRGPVSAVAAARRDDIKYAAPERSGMTFARAAFLTVMLLVAAGTPAGAQGAWAAVISLVGSAADMVGKLADGIKKAVDDGTRLETRPTFIRFRPLPSRWSTQSPR
jgi:hypothetical protein